MDCSPPGSLSTEFFRQEYWGGLPCPPSGDFPNPGIEPGSPILHWQADSYPLYHQGSLHSLFNCLIPFCSYPGQILHISYQVPLPYHHCSFTCVCIALYMDNTGACNMAIPIPKSLAGYEGFEGKSPVFIHSVCHTNSLWRSRNSVNTCSLKFVPCFLGFLTCKPKRAGHNFLLALINYFIISR